MTKTINSIKLFLCLLFCFVSSLIIISFFNYFSVTEVKATVCGNSNWVIKSSDYTGQGVNINYGDVGSGHDRKISVSAETGYVINEIWLDVDNDGHSGYYQYASGPLNNYNPNPGDEIFDAKVKVTYNCPATPTPTPTATPTPTHGCPTRTPTPTHGCYPTHSCPTHTPTLTQTPTITPTGSETPTPTPTFIEEITVTPQPSSTPTSVPSNNDGGDNGSSNPGPPTCNDADPGAPSNLRAVALGGGKVKLTWDNAPGPHTSYAVAYGPSEGNYLYGDPNVGNVTSYTVLALNPGGKYCFYVQAQNGCKGGVPSNVVCTNQGVGSFRVLGITDNYNPLVDGIKESYGGEVLGESTELMGTAEVVYSSEKLPSGNTLLEGQSISIPAIGVNQALYQPQIIADQLAVGQHEVLNTTVNGSNVFYGHNGFDVFGSLYRVVKGNQIIVNSGLQKLTYTVVSTHFVNKNDVSVLKTDANQIVLVTCSYTQPDYRIVVKALLQP